jgi:hypothetical protein
MQSSLPFRRIVPAGLLILGACADPTAPQADLRVLSSGTGSYSVVSLHVIGDVLVTEGFDPLKGGRIRSFSLANPAAPLQVDQADVSGIGRSFVEGTTLWLPRRTFPIGTAGDSINAPSFVSYDIGADGKLTPLHEFRLTNIDPVFVAVRNGYAYVFDFYGTNGMYVFSLADLPPDRVITRPALKRLPLPGNPLQMVFDGDYAYLALGDAGMGVIDLADPANPRLVTNVIVTSGSVISRVHVSGKYVYATNSLRVSVIDVSTPSHPTVAGTTLLGTLDNGPIVSWSFLHNGQLVCVDAWGLYFVDVSDPARPRLAEQMTLPMQSVPLTGTARGDFYYVGSANSGVLVVGK